MACGPRRAWSGCTAILWSATAESWANTPSDSTTNSWLFPPETEEVQFDEKWSFVYKKQEHCDPTDPADAQRGDWWDHTAYDPEHKLVLCVTPGPRMLEQTETVVLDVYQRTEGRPLRLMTSDDYPAYKDAIRHVYGTEVTTTPTGRDSHRMVPEK